MKKIQPLSLVSNLSQFIGTENYYKNFFGTVYTDGIKYLAEETNSYWLIDLVSSYQTNSKVNHESFQVYHIEVVEDTLYITVTDGRENVLTWKEYEYTDFPLSNFYLYYVDEVLMLPSEY